MNSFDEKHKELIKLEATIYQMRIKLHNMLMNKLDPLDDEVLALSMELDKVISKYTSLKRELKGD